VHILIVNVGLVRRVVFLGCQAHHALVVDVNSQRLAGIEQHINAEVEFQVFQKVRFVYVSLNHKVFLRAQLTYVIDKENPSPLTLCLRLGNEHIILILF